MLEILESPIWAIDPRYFAQHERIIHAMIERGADADLIEKQKANRPVMRVAVIGSAGHGADAVSYMVATAAASKSGAAKVAVIPLAGPVSKNGGMCSYGSKDIIAWIDKANTDPEVSAIVLETDSPGGAVDGTEALANAVKNSGKPIVGFIDGLAASAAYWAISQTSQIYISSATTAWAGSIGTLIRHVDSSEALAKSGQKVTYITADRSTHKVLGNGTEPLTEEALAYFKADLNAINDTFVAAVEAGRGEKLTAKDDVFSAKIYNGQQAIKNGLVDKVGTLQDAILYASKLAKSSAKPNSTANKNSEMLQFPKFASLLGFKPSADASAPDQEVTEDNLATAESAIAALETERDNALEAQRAAEAQITTLTTQKTALQARVDQLEAWKKESTQLTPKAADELNKAETPSTAKTAYEIEADKFREQVTGKKA